MKMKLRLSTFIVFGISFFAFLCGGAWTFIYSKAREKEAYEDLDKFIQVYDLVKKNYVKEPEDEVLVDGAIQGMLDDLDPHSVYLSKKDFTEMQADTKGEYGGLGIEISKRDDLNCYGSFADLSGYGPTWQDPWSIPSAASVSYNPDRKEFSWQEVVCEADPDLEKAGLMAYHALRIAAGRPEIEDIDDRSLPHEYDWLNSAVHLSKGCYRGQESVSKVHNLGHPPRRLALLHLEQGDMIAASGDEISYQEKIIGHIVAGALHYEDGSIALALLNRNTPYLDLVVHSGESKISATQTMLVPHDAGKAANLPRPAAFKLSAKR